MLPGKTELATSMNSHQSGQEIENHFCTTQNEIEIEFHVDTPQNESEIENHSGIPKMKLKFVSNSMKKPVGHFQEIQRSNPKVRPNTKPKNKKWVRTPKSYTSKVKSKKMLTSAKSQGQGQTGIILSTDSQIQQLPVPSYHGMRTSLP